MNIRIGKFFRFMSGNPFPIFRIGRRFLAGNYIDFGNIYAVVFMGKVVYERKIG